MTKSHDDDILKLYGKKEYIMVVTATRFKANIGQYLDNVSKEDSNDAVYITKNGKMVAKLSNPMEDKLSILNSLVGILPKDHISLEDARMERILRRAYPELRSKSKQ